MRSWHIEIFVRVEAASLALSFSDILRIHYSCGVYEDQAARDFPGMDASGV